MLLFDSQKRFRGFFPLLTLLHSLWYKIFTDQICLCLEPNLRSQTAVVEFYCQVTDVETAD